MMPLAAGLKLRDELLSLVQFAPEPVHLSAARLGNAWPAYRAFSLRIEATRFRCAALSFAMAAGPSAWRLLLSHLGLGLTTFTSAIHYPLRGLPFNRPTRSAGRNCTRGRPAAKARPRPNKESRRAMPDVHVVFSGDRWTCEIGGRSARHTPHKKRRLGRAGISQKTRTASSSSMARTARSVRRTLTGTTRETSPASGTAG